MLLPTNRQIIENEKEGDLEPWVQGTPRPENKNRAGHLTCSTFVLMRKMGLEPTRLYKHKILSLACLPIPALPHIRLVFLATCL